MKEVSKELLRQVDAAKPRLLRIGELESAKPILLGGWSRKQVIGHLIDSASNNHQRFVLATLQPSLEFPGYDQDGSVRVQAIQEANWDVLVNLWTAYNRGLRRKSGVHRDRTRTHSVLFSAIWQFKSVNRRQLCSATE
jgi:hypothetical protein